MWLNASIAAVLSINTLSALVVLEDFFYSLT